MHKTQLEQEVVTGQYLSNQSILKQNIFSSNQSSQYLSNQSILLINPDSAPTHHYRPTFNNESEDDVVREDMVDKVIIK